METLKKLTERIAKIALAMHQAAMAEDWKKMADCDVHLGDAMEIMADMVDTELTMEQLGFENDQRRIVPEAELTANVSL